jgi:S-formylglutathione hydrolase
MVARYGTPEGGIDAAFWADNNPATIADRDPKRLASSALAIYIEVGSEDAFGLDRGTDFLHQVLYRHGIRHEYRYVLGADHVGRSLPPRIRDGLAFLGRILEPPQPDPQLEQTRRLIDAMKRRAGVAP